MTARQGLGRRAWARLVAARPASVLWAAWAYMLLYSFPGQLTRDSIDHLREARLNIFTDSHPPIIILVFKLCDFIVAGPIGMLVLQNAMLILGLYAIFQIAFAPRRAAWLTAAVFISPPVLGVMAVIWKDCMMAGLLAVGIAGLLSPRRSRNRLALLALCGATAMRYNSFGATLPVIVLLFSWRPGLRAVPRYALAFATWLVVTVAAFGINSALTNKQMHYWHSSLAVFDIVGTYVHVDGTIPDEELRAELAGTQLLVEHGIHARMRELYTPKKFFPITDDPATRLWSLPIIGFEPAPKEQRDAIERAYWHVIARYPWAYVQHRLAATAAVLDLESSLRTGAVNRRAPLNKEYQQEMGISTTVSFVQLRLTRAYFYLSRHSPLFLPWVYLAISLLLLPMAWRQRDVMALLLSGLIMESSLLFLAHSVDYRYSHWMVISTIVSAIILAARRRRAARGEPTAPLPDPAPATS